MERLEQENIRTAEPAGMTLMVRDLGRMPYAEALALQRRLQAEVIAGRFSPETRAIGTGGATGGMTGGDSRPGYLLLVEHDPPVITVSGRATARQNLIASPAQLAQAGIEVAETDRGGDITYHGPGQLVAYPILDLNALGLRLHGYMRLLEDIVIETLAHFGIEGRRDPSATGVWIQANAHGLQSAGFENPSAKICAMGVRVSRWVSMHGLALNVTTNLDHFQTIVPCGLVGRPVTSMARELGDRCPPIDDVKRVLAQSFQAHIKAHGWQSVGVRDGH